MNRRSYKRGYRAEIVRLLLTYGVLPYDVFQLYPLAEARQWQRKAHELKKEGVVAIRRAINGAKYLALNDYPERKEEYIRYYPDSLRKRYESEGNVRRLKTMSLEGDNKINRAAYMTGQEKVLNDIYALYLLAESGIDTSPDKKDVWHDLIDENDALGYSSAEIKKLKGYHDKVETEQRKGGERDEMKKLYNSRINSLAITPGGCFAVYTALRHLPEWKRSGEVRMQTYLANVLADALPYSAHEEIEVSAIVMSKSENLFAEICRLEYSAQNKGRRTAVMNIDYSYAHMYAIPYSKEGITTLKIMQFANWQQKIKTTMLPHDEIVASADTAVECDGYDKETGRYKLVFCIPDMVKLKNFIKRADVEDNKEKFTVICYTHQVGMIVALAGKIVSIKKIDIDTVYDYIRKKEDAGEG